MKSTDTIISGAIAFFNRRPGASMAQLAEGIGVSRATLHRHFATREALIHELGVRGLDSWERSQDVAGIDGAAASGEPGVIAETLEALLRSFVAGAEEHGFALTDHFLLEMPDLVERVERLEARELAFYEAARRAGVLRDDLPARWVSNHVYGLMVAVAEGLRTGAIARRDAEDLAVTTFLRGAAR